MLPVLRSSLQMKKTVPTRMHARREARPSTAPIGCYATVGNVRNESISGIVATVANGTTRFFSADSLD